MRTVLHILTRPDDPLARDLVTRQTADEHVQVEVIDLTRPEPDYAALVTKVFAADAIAVW